jgi:long-chain acyl-CoA synthetase
VITRAEALQQMTAPGQPFEIVEASYWGRKARVFANAPKNLGEIYQAARSDLPFIIYDDERLSYEDVWGASCRLATALVEEFGVTKGDRVANSMRNYPEWMIAFCAATSIGAIAVAMNAMWQPNEMEYALNDSRPKVLVVDPERLGRYGLCEKAPPDIQVIAVRTGGAVPDGVRTWDKVMGKVTGTGKVTGKVTDKVMPAIAADVLPDDEATILYTSGSTGYPKGAVSSHRNIISALLSWELDAAAAVATGLVDAPPADDRPAMLLGVPLFHVTGSHAAFLQSFRAQRRLIVMYKWDVERGMELIEREKVTAFVGTPAITGDLVDAAPHTSRDLSSIRLLGGGGSARAPKQVRDIDTRFSQAKPGTGWGMTETNAIGVGIAASDYLEHPESSGRCSAVLDIRVVAPDGRELPVGERGELQVRGASIFKGYWNRPDANAEFFDGDWIRTGDVGYVDPDGFVYIVDRIKDMVIRGGENVGCGGVEAALLEHPSVIEACVYGVPDPRLNEEVAATLYVSSRVDEKELLAFLIPRLAKFAIPRYVHQSLDPLPRTASGKILKRELRKEAVTRLGL